MSEPFSTPANSHATEDPETQKIARNAAEPETSAEWEAEPMPSTATAHDMPVMLARLSSEDLRRQLASEALAQTGLDQTAITQASDTHHSATQLQGASPISGRSFTALLKSVESRREMESRERRTLEIGKEPMQSGTTGGVTESAREQVEREQIARPGPTAQRADVAQVDSIERPRAEAPAPQRERALKSLESDGAWTERNIDTVGDTVRTGSAISKTLGVMGGVVVLAGVGFGAYYYLSSRTPSPVSAPAKVATAAPKAGEPESPLELRVEIREKGLLGIRWNANAAPITNAKQGRLVIMERDQTPQIVELAAAQLRIGHVYYQTPVDHVEFRLEVTDPAGNVTQESFMALARNAAGLPNVSPNVSPNNVSSSVVTHGNANGENASRDSAAKSAVPASTNPTAPASAASATTPAAEKQRPRVFQAPAPKTARAVFLEPPADNLSLPALPLSALPVAIATPQPVGANGVAPPPPTAAPAPTNATAPHSASALTPAILLKRVAPDYPPIARQSRIQGTVRLQLTVGKNGLVQGVRVLNGHPVLTPAALAAVKQWVFTPSLLDGQPQESITDVDINFSR